MKSIRPIVLLATALAVPLCFGQKGSDAEPAVSFEKQVKPVLAYRCINCHHSDALFGNLNLENRKLAFAKRPQGPVIVPGSPEKSPLYVVLTLPPKKTKKAMPPTGHRIDKEQVELIRQWIKQGAVWPEGKAGVIKPSPAVKTTTGKAV